MILQFFLPLFLATAATLFVTPLCIKAAVRLDLLDIPNSAPHKIHVKPVPKAGGIAIVAALFLVTLGSGKLFDADNASITLITLERAASALGKKLKVELGKNNAPSG